MNYIRILAFLLSNFCSKGLLAQEGEAERIATRNMRMVSRQIDTVVLFTVCDHHGFRAEFSRKIRMHIMFNHAVALIEILAERKNDQKNYYFDKGLVIMSEYETDEGDIVVNYYHKPLTNECLYNIEGRFIFALYELVKTLPF